MRSDRGMQHSGNRNHDAGNRVDGNRGTRPFNRKRIDWVEVMESVENLTVTVREWTKMGMATLSSVEDVVEALKDGFENDEPKSEAIDLEAVKNEIRQEIKAELNEQLGELKSMLKEFIVAKGVSETQEVLRVSTPNKTEQNVEGKKTAPKKSQTLSKNVVKPKLTVVNEEAPVTKKRGPKPKELGYDRRLKKVNGLGPRKIEMLLEVGINSLEQLVVPDDVEREFIVESFGNHTKILKSASEVLKEYPER